MYVRYEAEQFKGQIDLRANAKSTTASLTEQANAVNQLFNRINFITKKMAELHDAKKVTDQELAAVVDNLDAAVQAFHRAVMNHWTAVRDWDQVLPTINVSLNVINDRIILAYEFISLERF